MSSFVELMSAAQIAAAREQLGLTQEQLAPLLGFEKRHSLASLETGARTILAAQQRLLNAYLAGYRPDDWPAETQRRRQRLRS